MHDRTSTCPLVTEGMNDWLDNLQNDVRRTAHMRTDNSDGPSMTLKVCPSIVNLKATDEI